MLLSTVKVARESVEDAKVCRYSRPSQLYMVYEEKGDEGLRA